MFSFSKKASKELPYKWGVNRQEHKKNEGGLTTKYTKGTKTAKD